MNDYIHFYCNGLSFPPDEMESLLSLTESELQISLKLALTANANIAAILNREEYLSGLHAEVDLPVFLSSADEKGVSVQLSRIPSFLAPGGKSLRCYCISLPPGEYESRYAGLMKALSVLPNLVWGSAVNEKANLVFSQILHHPDQVPPAGLPALVAPGKLLVAGTPFHAAWIQIWSADSWRILNLTASRQREGNWKQETLPNGAVFLQLSDFPLDLQLETDLATLQHFYSCFPALGRNL